MAQLTADAGSMSGTAASERVSTGKGAIAGIVVGTLAVLLAFVYEGGDLTGLVLPSPILIVLGGTIGALLIAHPASDVGAVPSYIGRALAGQTSGVGARVLKDGALYAVVSGLIGLLLGFVVIFSGMGSSSLSNYGHALAVGMLAPLFGIVVGLVLHAFSRRLQPAS